MRRLRRRYLVMEMAGRFDVGWPVARRWTRWGAERVLRRLTTRSEGAIYRLHIRSKR